MKTTVKDFILDNMSDSNFEKLVDMLILDRVGSWIKYEMVDKVSEYLNIQQSSYTENNTFESLRMIEKRTDDYIKSMEESYSLNNEFPMDDYPIVAMNNSEEDSDSVELDSFELAIEIEPDDVNTSNYKQYVGQVKGTILCEFSNFILEILNDKSDKKVENDFEEFSNERSHVKIDKDNEYGVDYCVHFLLDDRTRYISDKTHEAYFNKYDVKYPVGSPKFVEYEELQEDLSDYRNVYILEPFTNYLNEELIVPKVSEKVLYEILEQFIHILTHQGFSEKEQIENRNYFNESYEEDKIIDLHML